MGYFSDMPMLGIVTGLVLTVIIQSSSAMVGILQALSVTGVMTFELVYPIIMGINLGTCVTTAMVCPIGSSKDAKRTGVVHIVFNTIGTILFMIVMSLLRQAGFFSGLWGGVVDSGGIANFQTLFNLATAIVLVPFTGLLVKLACKIVKDDPVPEDKYPELASLDEKLMISPAVALGQVNGALVAMVKAAQENISKGLEQIRSYDATRAEEINACEERLDEFTDRAENYLITLSGHAETEQENLELNLLMQCIPNVERIGDYATNFDEMGKKLYDTNGVFSESAKRELDTLCDAVEEILRLTVEAMETGADHIARRIEPLEEVIDDMVLILQDRHTKRLKKGDCSVETGLVFMECLTYLERASDQCSSIAVKMLARDDDAILNNHHEYLRNVHAGKDSFFNQEMDRRKAQYLEPLKNIQL
jgi:phosphate:Na+ symporter